MWEHSGLYYEQAPYYYLSELHNAVDVRELVELDLIGAIMIDLQ